MNNSNFNPNEEIEAMKTTDAAETPVDDTPAADKAVAAETATEATASEPDVKQETVEETASEPADKADDADEAPASAAYKSAHMTAAAAALNVEGEEVDIRRRQPRVQKEIKKSPYFIREEKRTLRLRIHSNMDRRRNLYVHCADIQVGVVLNVLHRACFNSRAGSTERNDLGRYLYRVEQLRKL